MAICGRRREVLVAAARELGGSEEVLAVPGDVSDPGQAAAVVDTVVDGHDGLDILVNNAGIAKAGAVEALSDRELSEMIDVDLKGPFYMVRAALSHLRRSHGGAILNISSSVTLMALRDYSVYSAAKAGLDMMTRCLALELATDRIRVNSINPGVVKTPIFDTMMPADQVDGFLEGFADQVPLGRYGQPEDVARMALALCHPDNDWVTGVVLPVDGGLSLGPI